jgi:hypothetical protein
MGFSKFHATTHSAEAQKSLRDAQRRTPIGTASYSKTVWVPGSSASQQRPSRPKPARLGPTVRANLARYCDRLGGGPEVDLRGQDTGLWLGWQAGLHLAQEERTQRFTGSLRRTGFAAPRKRDRPALPRTGPQTESLNARYETRPRRCGRNYIGNRRLRVKITHCGDR